MAFEDFEKEYEENEREYVIVRNDDQGGAVGRGKENPYWCAVMDILAYVNCETEELVNEEGCLLWPMSYQEGSKREFFQRFKKGGIYRIKARQRKEDPNYFYVTDVVEENVSNAELEAVLEDYRTPVVLEDEVLGTLNMDKDLSIFEGKATWKDTEIPIYLDIKKDNKGSWTKAKNAMKQLLEEQVKWDREMRTFAAHELTDIANAWQLDKNAPKITETEISLKIAMREVCITSGGTFYAYYGHEKLFLGNSITITGNLKKGIKSAEIED